MNKRTDIFEDRGKAYEYALAFKHLNELRKDNYKFYKFIHQNGWINDYNWFQHKWLKWDYEHTYNEAKKYKTKSEFMKGSGGAYAAAIKNKWINDYVWFVKPVPQAKFTYDFCYNIALGCNSSKEMQEKSPTAYSIAIRKGWKKDYTWFRYPKQKEYVEENKHFVYCYKDYDNKFIYVGITKTVKRDKQHRNIQRNGNGDSVKEYFDSLSKPIPEWEILESGLSCDEASIKEKEWLDKFISDGWNKINRANPGSVGSTRIKWTKENIIEESKKYKSKKDFTNNASGAYTAACKCGIIKDLVWEEVPFRWDETKVEECIHLYRNRRELSKKNRGLYCYLERTNLLDKYFPLPPKMTKENAIKISQQYKTLSEFKKENEKLYRYCLSHKWMKEFTWLERYNDKRMTDDACIEIAKTYRTKTEFYKGNQTAYSYAKKHKLLKKMTWMVRPEKKKMTIEQCIKISKKFLTLSDFKKQEYSAYRFAVRYKIIKSFTWLKRH